MMRSFDDINQLRQSIIDGAISGLSKIEPVEQGGYSLTIRNVSYQPVPFSAHDVKNAMFRKETLAWPIKGYVEFRTPQGQVISKQTTLAFIPYLTNRGSFIIDGVEYFVSNQQRLKPGIFVFNRLSGEPVAHINVAAGKAHRYIFNPSNKVFYFNIGQANIPLYPLLRELGITDDQLLEAWGNEVLLANKSKDNDRYLKEIRAHLNIPEGADLKEVFKSFSLDPNVVKRNLGIDSPYISPEVTLAATRKMIELFKGTVEKDDRDALVNQMFYGVDDLISEYLQRSRPILRKLLWKLMRNPKKETIPANFLSPQVLAVFRKSGLASIPDAANPLEIIDNLYRISRVGEGSITNVDSIPTSARDVHPTHFGFIDPVTTPESLKIGVDCRISVNAKRIGNDLAAPFRNLETNQVEYLTPQQVYESYVAFPGELAQNRNFVFGLYRGRETVFPKHKAQYELEDITQAFGPLANLIPLKSTTFPHRIAMGSRMLMQALPLVNREPQLVRSLDKDGRPFIKTFSKYVGAVYSPAEGVIKEVADDKIVILDNDRKEHVIDLMVNMPYSNMTGITQQPVVKPGQSVKKDQLIAVSNYTDNEGNIAIGINARVGYLATGETYEDAYVISESFAKRLASDHLFRYEISSDDESIVVNKTKYIATFPGKYPKDQLDKYDENGLIKPGSRVKKGDPLILAVKELPVSTIGRRRLFQDVSEEWEWDVDGVVVDAVKTDAGYQVLVKTTMPTRQGDKISGLYGNKGVVIVKPDSEMPYDENGPLDILISPFSVISRGNVGQIYEALLGKVAKKLGQPIELKDFSKAGQYWDYVKDMLAKANLEASDELYDPVTNRKIKVLTGYAYFLKLHHLAEDKLQGIGIASSYSSEGIPIAGEEGSSKRLGLLDMNALLSHAAYNTITDASLVRGQQDEDLWRVFMMGYALPKPKMSQVWAKFIHLLQAAGINPISGPKGISIYALKQSDIERLTGNRLLQNGETVRFKDNDFQPIEGGLFDKRLTGGLDGDLWSAIRLPFLLPNPIMLRPLASILGVSINELENILVGKAPVPEHFGTTKTGPEAIYDAVKNINLDYEIQKTEEAIKTASASKRNMLIQKLGYLKAAKKFDCHPSEWFWDKVPVIPPKFRPISALSNNILIVNDLNYLYKELIRTVDAVQKLQEGGFQDSSNVEAVWKVLKALIGLEQNTIRMADTNLRGVLRLIIGSNPKEGIVQRKMIGTETALVGRGVVTPNPNLDIDQIGIPQDIAYTIYKPFIVRNLKQKGVSLVDALKMVKERHPAATAELHRLMEERPVIVNRAPVWHKYGIMAFKPVLTASNTIEVPPLVTAGFGMDFDGDQVQFHVPVSDEAVREAKERLLPSKNLFSAATLKTPMTLPSQDYLMGLWRATQTAEKPKRVFATADDAIRAYEKGEISIDQPVVIQK